MSDLLNRLRTREYCGCHILRESADRIEELESEVKEWESGALVRGWREKWADTQGKRQYNGEDKK